MKILYEDGQIVVCVKPVGLDSEQEVPTALKEQLGGEIFPIHRLDKNVGGVMVYARNKQAAAQLSKTITNGDMVKEYDIDKHTEQGYSVYLFCSYFSSCFFFLLVEFSGVAQQLIC